MKSYLEVAVKESARRITNHSLEWHGWHLRGSVPHLVHTQNSEEPIKVNGHFAHLCYDAVDTFNEFISGLDGLKSIPVQPEDYLLASDLWMACNFLPIDALHLSAMRRAHIRNIASRDRDFEQVDGIVIWSP